MSAGCSPSAIPPANRLVSLRYSRGAQVLAVCHLRKAMSPIQFPDLNGQIHYPRGGLPCGIEVNERQWSGI